MLVTLGGNSARSEEKNLCFHNRLLLRASSQTLTPVLCRELSPMAAAAENRSGRHHHLHAGVTEASAAVPRSAALPVLVADSAEDGMWNRGPARFGSPSEALPYTSAGAASTESPPHP